MNFYAHNNHMSTSERRAFQQISTESGKILIVAMDQRNSMRSLLVGENNSYDHITDKQLGAIKSLLVKNLGNYAPALLLDPECALPKVIDEGIISRSCSLIIGMDASGYDLDEVSNLRNSRVVEGMSARKVRELGGIAGKLLVYMRPGEDGDPFAENLIQKTVEDYKNEDLLLIIEILVYKLENESEEEYLQKKPHLILESARIAKENGAKLLKLQYPGSAEMCRKITETLGDTPWAVLSQGVNHDVFIKQLIIAIKNGARGAIAGRSLWKDCLSLNPGEMDTNLRKLALPRLDEMLDLLNHA